MKVRAICKGLIVVGCLAALSAQLCAQEAEKKSRKRPRKEKQEGRRRGRKKAELSPEMKKVLEMAAPGWEHEKLASVVGMWDATTKYWPAPGAPAQESKATCRYRSVLGGRFVQQDYRGTYMNIPYRGMGLMGYDKLKKEYVSVWVDSMGTGMMTQTGTLKDKGQSIIFTGEATDPMTGQKKKYYSVIRIESPEKHVHEMYVEGPDGNEVKMLEITYTRRPPRAKEKGAKGSATKEKRPRRAKRAQAGSVAD